MNPENETKESSQAVKKMSFFSKNKTICPVCGQGFFKEEMLTGRGRLISTQLNMELRRIYQPIPGYGIISPLMYSMTTCPYCLTSLFSKDFTNSMNKQNIENFAKQEQSRKDFLNQIDPTLYKKVASQEPRDLQASLATYILGILCYMQAVNLHGISKAALCALRASWLVEDILAEQEEGKALSAEEKARYQKIYTWIRTKTAQLFEQAGELVSKGKENIQEFYFGPDADKNFGFEGFIYLQNYFLFKSSLSLDPIEKMYNLERIKKSLGSVFGLGKSSSEKPSAILQYIRTIFDEVSEELNALQADREM